MELAFTMPHVMGVRALTMPWEREVNGKEMMAFAQWAEKLGYAMIAVPGHLSFPTSTLNCPAPIMSPYPTMAYIAGGTNTIRVNSSIESCRSRTPS